MTPVNKTEIEEIYVEFSPKVLRYVSARIFDRQEAEDLTSAVFLKVVSAIDSFERERASLSTWIYTIAQNTVRDYMRRTKTRGEHITGDELSENLPFIDGDANGDSLIREEMLEELATALEKLPERERDIIIYHYYKGLSHKDIAEKMNLGYSNVRFLCHRAVTRLREELEPSA